MSNFTGALTLTEGDLDDWAQWRLEQPLVFDTGSGTITVPPGFTSDGASVPRPLWWLLPAWGRHSRAAVLHDFLCRSIAINAPHALAPTRKVADSIFYDAMVVCGVNTTLRWLMWAAVRLYSIFAG